MLPIILLMANSGISAAESPTLLSGGDLAAAIAAAQSDDVIILADGGTYDISSQVSNSGKTLTIRAVNGYAVRPTIRSGNGTGNYVHVRGADGHWYWLPLEGTDISANGGNPGHASYVGPHVNSDGGIDLSRISSAKCAGELDAFNHWPAAANPGDYDTLRGAGSGGFTCTGGVLTFRNVLVHGFDNFITTSGGEVRLEGSVAIGGKTMFDMNGGSVSIIDSLCCGGAQQSWTWLEVKAGGAELDPEGKRTLVNAQDAAGGTLTLLRSTFLDFFDLIVGNPSSIVVDADQFTVEGRTDDFDQLQADTRGDLTARRGKVRATFLSGSSSTVGADGVTRLVEDCVVANWRELLDFGDIRWRRHLGHHGDPTDPAIFRRCTFIEQGGTNDSGVIIIHALGALWRSKPARHQVWEDFCLAMMTSTGLIGRDFADAGAGELDISGTSILNASGGTLSFEDGGDFATWKVNSGDSTAELLADQTWDADELWADPRRISALFGHTVGAVPAAASHPFEDAGGQRIGDPNEWSAELAP